MRKRVIAGAVAGLLVAAAAPAGEAGLSARTLDGGQVTPTTLRGKVVIVNFWATWCAPCRVELPMLDAFYRAHRAEGVTLIAVAMDAGGPTRRIAAATKDFAFPVARIDDVALPRRDLPAALPATRIYDRAGVLRWDSRATGGTLLDRATLERIVAPLLPARAPAG